MAELKHCPFCGGKAQIIADDPFDGYQGDCTVHLVICGDCRAKIVRTTEEKAIEAWNNRVPQTTVNQFGENCTHISNCGTLNLNL